MSNKFVYTKNSRKTIYQDHEYDSRLEATWAAFFTLRGISFTPQPDLGLKAWLPDFLVNLGSGTMLAEVKPFYNLKQWRDEYTEAIDKINSSHDPKAWFQVALLGVSPSLPTSFYYSQTEPDLFMEPDATDMVADFEDIDFGDSSDVIAKWNGALKETAWKWGG